METSTPTYTHLCYDTLFQPFNFSPTFTQPITAEEIKRVIDDWSSNKTPRPDGFTGEFYKTFQCHLIHDLLQVYNTTMQDPTRSMAPLNDAYIALIPKNKPTINTSD
jgi:hypothetical protein